MQPFTMIKSESVAFPGTNPARISISKIASPSNWFRRQPKFLIKNLICVDFHRNIIFIVESKIKYDKIIRKDKKGVIK